MFTLSLKALKTRLVIIGLIVALVGSLSLNYKAILAIGDDSNYPTIFKPNSGWVANTIQLVSDESDSISEHPFIFIDGNNVPHITWSDYSDIFGALPGMQNIFYSHYDSDVNNWTGYFNSTDVIFSDPSGSLYQPSIVIDSQNNIHIAFTVFSNIGGSGIDPDIFYIYYNANTNAWGGKVNSTYDIISTESIDDSYVPRMCLGQDDSIYIIWTDFSQISGSSSLTNIFFKYFDEQLVQWKGFVNQTDIISDECTDYIWLGDIECDTNDILHVAWADNTDIYDSGVDHDIHYKYYDDTSQQWIGHVNHTDIISTDSPDVSAKPNLVVDNNDYVHIAWVDWSNVLGSGPNYDVFYKYWDGFSWKGHANSTDVISSLSTLNAWHPILEVDPLGYLHFVWQDATDILGSGIDWDIFHRIWNTTSSEYSTINLVSEGLDGRSWRPDFKIDDQGNLHICWEDDSDYESAGIDYDILYRKYNYVPHIPDAPFLNPIIAYPDFSGRLYLEWTEVFSATAYNLYRDTSIITDVQGLTPIETTDQLDINDLPPADGTYYYVVTALNSAGESLISNVRSADVELPVTTDPDPTETDTTTDETRFYFLTILSFTGITVIVLVYRRKFRK